MTAREQEGVSKLYRAIGKSMMARYVSYGANVLSLLIFARIFTPEVFGIIAAAQAVVLLFQLIAEAGLAPAIIDLNRLEVKDRDGIFGLTLFMGVVAAAAFSFSSSALARFYEMHQVSGVGPHLAVALLCNTAAVLPMALLQRQQFFFRIAQASLIAEFGALGVALSAHYYGVQPLHAYALFFPTRAALSFAVSWNYTEQTEFGRPRPGLKFVAILPVLRTAGFQLAFNIVNYISRNFDQMLVGKYLGAASLGIYDRSYQLMRYPLLLLTFAMTPAIQPVLREHSCDPAAMRKVHLGLVSKLSVFGTVSAVAIYGAAPQIVSILFGPQWLSVVPVMKILALTIPVQVILSTSGSFFQAARRTDLLFTCGLFSCGVNLIAIVWGVTTESLEGLCWALFCSFHVNFLHAYYVLHKHIFGGGFGKFSGAVAPAMIPIALIAILHS